MRLLIVEDDRAISTLLQDVLKHQDHVVVGAARGLTRALALARSVSHDCAIVDIDLNGKEALPLIELLETLRSRFVLITGLSLADIASPRLRKMPLLMKPFDLQALNGAIERACRDNV